MVVYTYDPDKNLELRALMGVPLRDLTDEDMASLPPYLAEAVPMCGLYVPVAVRAARATLPKPSETKGAEHGEG